MNQLGLIIRKLRYLAGAFLAFLLLFSPACSTKRIASSAPDLEALPLDLIEATGPLEDLRLPIEERDWSEALMLAENLRLRMRETNVKTRLSFVMAYIHVQLKHWKLVLDFLNQAEESTALGDRLSDYVAFFRGRAFSELQLPEQAISEFQTVVGLGTTSRFEREAILYLGKAQFEARRYQNAIETFRRYRYRFPNADRLDQSIFYEAKAFSNLQQFEEAAILLTTLNIKFPTSPLVQEAMEDQEKLRSLYPELARIMPNYKDLLNRGLALQSFQKYKKARKQYEELRKFQELTPEQRFEIELSVARTYFLARQYSKAVQEFQKLYEHCTTRCASNSPDEIIYWLARAHSRLGHYDEARLYYNKLLEKYPRSGLAESVLFSLAALAQEQRQILESVALYEKYLNRYPSGQFRESATWFIAWQMIAKGNYEKAIQELNRVHSLENNRLLLPASRFWKGYCFERLDNYDRAYQEYQQLIRNHPLDYYYDLALARMADIVSNQRLNPQFISWQPWVDSSPADSFSEAVWNDPSVHNTKARPFFRRGVALLESGLNDLGTQELARALTLTQKNYSNLLQLGRLFLAGSDYNRAHYIASTYFNPMITSRNKEHLNGTLLHLSFPRAYRDYVDGNEFGVPPPLTFAIMREESHFNPTVTSPAGALGLMQLLPETAEQIARQLGHRFTEDQLFIPRNNIRFGTWYLKSLLSKYDHDLPRVIAAYNAGPQAVDEWITQFGSEDPVVFVEMIPYRETRQYVKRVLRSYRMYNWLHVPSAAEDAVASFQFHSRATASRERRGT